MSRLGSKTLPHALGALRWLVLALLPLPAAVATADIDLVYQGYVGGTKAGQAHVRLLLDGDDYAVEGRIRTKGIWNRLSPWRADFSATGSLADGKAVFQQLDMIEEDRKKHRVIQVANGILSQIRNGEERPDRAAPVGKDVFSALWITTVCFDAGTINNGRRFYNVTRIAHELAGDGSETCRYDVINKDGQRHTGEVRVERRLGRRVPVVIEFDRGMDWTLKLTSARLVPAAPEAVDEADRSEANVTALLVDD